MKEKKIKEDFYNFLKEDFKPDYRKEIISFLTSELQQYLGILIKKDKWKKFLKKYDVKETKKAKELLYKLKGYLISENFEFLLQKDLDREKGKNKNE